MSESQRSSPGAPPHPEHADGGAPLAHVASRKSLWSVFAALVLLTLVAVAAAAIETGAWEVWLSLGVASVKATLVAMYFMHLRYDWSFHAVIFVGAVLCLALFLALTLADAEEYRDDIRHTQANQTSWAVGRLR